MYIIKHFLLLISLLILCSQSQADERTEKLKKLLKNGFITEAEFKKLLNTTSKKTSKIKVKQISGKTGKEKFEK